MTGGPLWPISGPVVRAMQKCDCRSAARATRPLASRIMRVERSDFGVIQSRISLAGTHPLRARPAHQRASRAGPCPTTRYGRAVCNVLSRRAGAGIFPINRPDHAPHAPPDGRAWPRRCVRRTALNARRTRQAPPCVDPSPRIPPYRARLPMRGVPVWRDRWRAIQSIVSSTGIGRAMPKPCT